MSSGDEADGKRQRLDDDPKSKDQVDRRRWVREHLHTHTHAAPDSSVWFPIISFHPGRERNRVLARKTRLRKKFFFESLQRQVAQLAMENDMLKVTVRACVPWVQSLPGLILHTLYPRSPQHTHHAHCRALSSTAWARR
jgi:hypothetical protein